ncbi:hypothetical protein F5Y09DRAFT_343224 [Xylaria sp. FL1042]|nr:hypothetical protein F5Y09DRAFT_343224 [Xylaria sp. FL1042]
MRSFSIADRQIDPFIQSFRSLHVTLETVVYNNKTCQSEEGIELSKCDMLELTEKAKVLAPEGRLFVARLEDGFVWEQICLFLGHPIPETRYPRGNAPQVFQKFADEILGPRIRNASLKVISAVLIPW